MKTIAKKRYPILYTISILGISLSLFILIGAKYIHAPCIEKEEAFLYVLGGKDNLEIIENADKVIVYETYTGWESSDLENTTNSTNTHLGRHLKSNPTTATQNQAKELKELISNPNLYQPYIAYLCGDNTTHIIEFIKGNQSIEVSIALYQCQDVGFSKNGNRIRGESRALDPYEYTRLYPGVATLSDNGNKLRSYIKQHFSDPEYMKFLKYIAEQGGEADPIIHGNFENEHQQ